MKFMYNNGDTVEKYLNTFFKTNICKHTTKRALRLFPSLLTSSVKRIKGTYSDILKL